MTMQPGLFDEPPTGIRAILLGEGWVYPADWRADNLSTCRGCNEPILWCYTKAGKRAPVNRDGVNHFATCPASPRFKRKRRKR